MNKIHLSLSALGVMACLSMPVSAAIYFGTDTSGGAVDTSTLDWTFDGTGITWLVPSGGDIGTELAGGSDAGKPAGTAISQSHLFDGDNNHKTINENTTQTVAPLGFANHRNGDYVNMPAPTATWVLDMQQQYNIHQIVMKAGAGNGYYGMVGTTIDISSDNIHWTQIGSTEGILNTAQRDPNITWEKDAGVQGPVEARYLRITADGLENSYAVKLDQMDLYVSPVPEPGAMSLVLGGLVLGSAIGRKRGFASFGR